MKVRLPVRDETRRIAFATLSCQVTKKVNQKQVSTSTDDNPVAGEGLTIRFDIAASLYQDVAALLSGRWIHQHYLVFAVFADERVLQHHRHCARLVPGWLRRNDYLYLAKAREISLALE